ncbi:MAG: efflux RND transporter periplasmic adaptor subunit [Bacteroidaceae bacterium]|nr:efflux RND transporter periplasmic adaptor subunit [Bacteroidaceae bacterium]
MKYNFIAAIAIAASVLSLQSCKNSGSKERDTEKESELAKQEYAIAKNQVEVMTLERKMFNKQLVCNGRLEAVRRSGVSFQAQGILASIKVKDGDVVKKGQILAELDKEQLQSSMEQAQLAYDKAVLNLADRLLEYGYTLSDTASIPAEKRRIIYINSGYADALISYRNAQRNLQNAELRAPYSGKVVSVKAKEYESAGAFCTLIDDSYMTVRFNVLETEYDFVHVGQVVRVTPFNDNKCVIDGSVVSVNPSVDDHGQIAVTARVQNNGNLLDGMNVRILLENSVPDQLVVPKSAVVIRDNMEVLFRYIDGIARWTYVKVLLSNTMEHVVEANKERGAELNVGDLVITSGNLNLGDDAPVELVK